MNSVKRNMKPQRLACADVTNGLANNTGGTQATVLSPLAQGKVTRTQRFVSISNSNNNNNANSNQLRFRESCQLLSKLSVY